MCGLVQELDSGPERCLQRRHELSGVDRHGRNVGRDTDALEREAVVSLPGGELDIAWADDTAEILMSGPAAFVFEGEWLQ